MTEKKCGRRILFGDTELDQAEILDRQEKVRAEWSTETELIRRVTERQQAVLPREISICDLHR